MGNKSSVVASKGLFIDCNFDDYSLIADRVSPKNGIGYNGKYYQMPVKRIDNYTKEAKGDKKSHRRGDHLRKRDASEPNLTPKGHSKIENYKKVMVKNNSQLMFQKKKSTNAKNADFKKKSKVS